MVRNILLVSALLGILSGCTWPLNMTPGGANMSIGSAASIRGEVVGSIDDCAFDGICAAIVETDAGRVNVIWAQGMMQCQGQMQGDMPQSSVVEAYGEVTEPDTITICTDPSYYLRLADVDMP